MSTVRRRPVGLTIGAAAVLVVLLLAGLWMGLAMTMLTRAGWTAGIPWTWTAAVALLVAAAGAVVGALVLARARGGRAAWGSLAAGVAGLVVAVALFVVPLFQVQTLIP